ASIALAALLLSAPALAVRTHLDVALPEEDFYAQTVFTASWSPDGSTLVTGSRDGKLRFWSWDGENLTHVATVDGHEGDRPPEGYLRSLAWSPDGTKLVTVGFDGTIRIWDAASRSQERVITGHDDDYIRSVSFSPDGRMFVTAGNDG